MTYAGFLAIFLGPPLLALALAWLRSLIAAAPARADAQRHGAGRIRARLAAAALAVHVALALIYTTPWDNYLVATRVWYYDPARVLGLTLGWVPIEEYSFFVLQTLLTGGWVLWLRGRLAGALPPPDPKTGGALRTALLAAGALAWLAAVGLLLARSRPATYLALELAWLLPPIMLQLLVGGRRLWQLRRWVGPALLAPILYLAAADALAIRAGVWTINPARSLGILLGGVLPIEELIFFTLTNMLIVFGMVLMLTLPHEAPALRDWLQRRRRPQSISKVEYEHETGL